jgi:hypothetical protein
MKLQPRPPINIPVLLIVLVYLVGVRRCSSEAVPPEPTEHLLSMELHEKVPDACVSEMIG